MGKKRGRTMHSCCLRIVLSLIGLLIVLVTAIGTYVAHIEIVASSIPRWINTTTTLPASWPTAWLERASRAAQHHNKLFLDALYPVVLTGEHRQSLTTESSSSALATTSAVRGVSSSTELHHHRHNGPRVLAIVFPQFHSDPLNDKLWGPGFTDWDSLRSAPKENRLGYEIPRPTELGYYDLTDVEPRRALGRLAREYGIDGFVFHHYWFYDTSHPGPNLEAPLVKMLQDGEPNIPFCLHWCAVHWTKTWTSKSLVKEGSSANGDKGKDDDLLLQRQFFPDPDSPQVKEHYQWLRQFFHHPNYIKVNGFPVLMVYRKKPSSFPILKRLRELAIADGFPGLYITIGMTFTHDELFPAGSKEGQRRNQYPMYLTNRTVAYPNPLAWNEKQVLTVPERCRNENAEEKGRRRQKLHTQIEGILTSFDNTPRRGLDEANLWSGDDPDMVVQRFFESVRAAVFYETCCFDLSKDQSATKLASKQEDAANGDGRFILINSMNEWAEGMALEPSTVFGRRLLESVAKAKTEVEASSCDYSKLSMSQPG